MITVGSLFSGIGGIELGLERTKGFRTVWFVEKDPYCQAVLRKHWPNIPIYGDITRLDPERIEKPDMLTGGFPCQPVSEAGKRKAQADERWLWPEFRRLIGILRPRLVFVENVPGLLNANDGSAMGEVLGDLAALRYAAEWQSIPAAAVGAPHLRYRVFILANAQGPECERALVKKERRPRPADHDPVSDTEKQGLEGNESARPTFPYGRTSKRGAAMANSNSDRFTRPRLHAGQWRQNETTPLTSRLSKNVSDANESGRREELEPLFFKQRGRGQSDFARSSWWAVEPDVGRVAHGVPSRVERLRCLGNAVVPQVAQAIGEMILASLPAAD